MVIADLTDPMLTRQDAEVLFAVLLKQFSAMKGSKLAVFDEVCTPSSPRYLYLHMVVTVHSLASTHFALR